MASNLQVDQNLTATAQSVKDQNGQTSPLTLSVNKVGIGTATPEPSTKLDVAGEIQICTDTNPIHFTSVFRGWPSTGPNHAEISNDTSSNNALVIAGTYSANLGRRVRVVDLLEVVGMLKVIGDAEVTGDIRLINADCAEDFDICETEQIEPGTVMVLGEEGKLEQSQKPYDKRVAGVVSGAGDCKPGIVLDKQESENNRQPIALLGKVYCKVDAGPGAVEIGDLLTTSPTPGHAMKATDPRKAFGAVIGKALRPLTEGQGLIPILVALQ